jgi:homoserine dehydrogenase
VIGRCQAGKQRCHRLSSTLPAVQATALCTLHKSLDHIIALQERLGVDVELVGVSSSKRMLVNPAGVSLTSWQSDFENSASPADLSAFSEHMAALDSDAVIFDCTASDVPCDFYSRWMRAGVHVITPNKKLHSGPLERYAAVRKLQADGCAHYFYEVRCGLLHMQRSLAMLRKVLWALSMYDRHLLSAS